MCCVMECVTECECVCFVCIVLLLCTCVCCVLMLCAYECISTTIITSAQKAQMEQKEGRCQPCTRYHTYTNESFVLSHPSRLPVDRVGEDLGRSALIIPAHHPHSQHVLLPQTHNLQSERAEEGRKAEERRGRR